MTKGTNKAKAKIFNKMLKGKFSNPTKINTFLA